MEKNIKRHDICPVVIVVIGCIGLFLIILFVRNCKTSNSIIVTEHSNNSNYLFLRNLELHSQDISISHELLEKVSSNTFHLIFVYSGGECDKCIFEDIQMIKDEFGRENIDKVIVFPIFEDSRRTNISLHSDLEGIDYYRLDPLSVKLPQFNGFPVRFFCILSPTGETILPFFPDIGDTERTKEYFNFVGKKYLEMKK